MKYVFTIFMLGCGYYTLTYGVSQWKNEKNKLGGSATIALAVVGTVASIIALFITT